MQQTSSTPYALQALEQQVAALQQFDQFACVPGNELRILAEQAVKEAQLSWRGTGHGRQQNGKR